MKRVTIIVLLSFLVIVYSDAKSNSTFLNQLTGKIGEVTSADTFHEALVHIFDQNDNMLCNGVLTRKGTVIAVKEGLREVLEPKIQIPGRSRKMIINFRIDYKYIAEMKFEGIDNILQMDNVKYAKYLKKEMKPFDNATMVEWTEASGFKNIGAKILRVRENFITVMRTKRDTKITGRIGDPLFVRNKLVGILFKPEATHGFQRKYLNLLFGPLENDSGSKGFTYRVNSKHPELVNIFFQTH